MNTHSTYELTLDELDLVNAGTFSPGKIIGAGLTGAANGAANGGNTLAGRGIGAVLGFLFGAGVEIAKEM
jgi:hypothetical protein